MILDTIRTTLAIAASLVISLGICAQTDGSDPKRREKIEGLKRAFITEKLDLTVEQAEKFWPVYNDFAKQRKANHDAIRDARKKMNAQGITDKEILTTSAEITSLRHKEVEVDESYIRQVLPILGPEKTGRMIRLEEEFRRELMQKLHERKGNGNRQETPDGQRKR